MLTPLADTPRLTGGSQEETHSLSKQASAVFDGFSSAKGILLAVSGGPDSMAMMLLVADWVKNGGNAPVFVATVDHQLRPESRSEAEAVRRWAQALGLSHDILIWQGEKPKARVQELARAARYELLCAHADAIGADHLITGHHGDDQAETILFRLLRGSGLKGLGGMKPLTPRGNLTHARPLLGWAKADLVALCEAQGQAFFDDPSNRNPAYARTRLKELTGFLAGHGLDREAFLRLGTRLAKADAALEAQTDELFQNLALIESDGGFEVALAPLLATPDEIFERLLARLVHKSAAQATPLRLDRLEALAARLKMALVGGESVSATLGGATLRLSPDGFLQVRREPPRQRGTGRGTGMA